METKLQIFILVMVVVLSSCNKRITTFPSSSTPETKVIKDIEFFPQNLEVYANNNGKDKLLCSHLEQQLFTRKFLNIYFGPWGMKKTTIIKNDVMSPFTHPRGYKIGNIKWKKEEWNAMKINAGLSRYPSLLMKGITITNTDLRELPTHDFRFSEPTPDPRLNPFDYFQYSLLPIGTPLLIVHATMDGKWFYIETPIAGGWVDAKDIAFVNEEFITSWRNSGFVALIKDRVNLNSSDHKKLLLNIGTLLPLIIKDKEKKLYRIQIPIKNITGYASTMVGEILDTEAAEWPMPLTPENIASVGNQLIGQNYGWGGMFGDRDCSALIRDIFMPFGIWLPRNSSAQARKGQVISLSGLTAEEKQKIILSQGIPFLSLVGMKGHICLYIGKYQNKAAILHNVWGIRIVEDGNDDARFVIGKAVITSIMPGMELKNLYLPKTFTDRIRSLTILH